jgi:tetratricopeptide (TPR) repeat protein
VRSERGAPAGHCDSRGIIDANLAAMQKMIYALLLAAACATPGSDARPSASSGRISTDAVTALVKGDYAGALAIAERGLSAHPGDPWLLYDRGAAQAGLGLIEQSLETLRQAEQRFTDPHDRPLAAYRRALALEFAGRCAEASTELSRYAALVRNENPTLAEDAMAHLKFCFAPTAQQVAEREEAAVLRTAASNEKARRAEELSTESVQALVVGDYHAALAKADAGLELVPGDPWLIYNKGTALAGLEQIDEALTMLRQAERLFSESNIHGRSVAIYRRAMALEVAGRCAEESAELTRYANIAKPTEPDFIQHALAHVKFCKLANPNKSIY